MLSTLKIRHFRCFAEYEAEFAPDLNLIVGPNAHGKTSLLEAASILLRLESPRAQRLAEAIQHDRRGFVVDGRFGERHIQFYFSAERKKLALDSVEQKNAREHLKMARIMYFAMSDIDIVRGSAEARRRFIDFVAAQRDPAYRRLVRDYDRALRSRNALLKRPVLRWAEIDAFDSTLLAAGSAIAQARAALVEDLQPHANSAHHAIGAGEPLHIAYAPGAGSDFAAALHAARAEDARLRQTTVGPHRDDLYFEVAGRHSRFASEGQQRTLVLALKLGGARLLQAHFGSPPLLLLDDIFGELDLKRRTALLAALPAGSQKLITLTHLDWTPAGTASRIQRLGDA